MKLNIYSLKGVEFAGDVAGVNVKTAAGEITVLDNHLPLISVLEKGKLNIIKNSGAREEKQINSGFLEMDDKNNLKLLVD